MQPAFFGAYFLLSLPAGKVPELGYQRGIVMGLLMAGGPPIRGRFW